MADSVHLEAKVDVKDIVDAHIRAAIVTALGNDANNVIEKIVNIALAQKRNSYDKVTVFEDSVNAMIRTAAKEELTAFMERKKQVVRKAIRKRIDAESGDFIEKITDAVIKGLSNNFYVSANMRCEE